MQTKVVSDNPVLDKRFSINIKRVNSLLLAWKASEFFGENIFRTFKLQIMESDNAYKMFFWGL